MKHQPQTSILCEQYSVSALTLCACVFFWLTTKKLFAYNVVDDVCFVLTITCNENTVAPFFVFGYFPPPLAHGPHTSGQSRALVFALVQTVSVQK